VSEGVPAAQECFEHLASLGINISAWTDQLLQEGVASFVKSYDALLTSIQDKCALLRT
jgi:transaldolase